VKEELVQRTLGDIGAVVVSHSNWLQQLAFDNQNLRQELLDLKAMLATLNNIDLDLYSVQTEFPIAIDSNDHIVPWGTQNDNTRSALFVRACERLFPEKPVRFLDLGCSGGGIVFDFLMRGHKAFGLEGSDFSLRSGRANWSVIPRSLATCDISRPFKIIANDLSEAVFDVITLWEVFEHIPEERLDTLMSNIKSHLAEGGYVFASIALEDDVVDGVSYHPTVKPESWWIEYFASKGLSFSKYDFLSYSEHCRGIGNGPLDPVYADRPEAGFHCTLRLITK